MEEIKTVILVEGPLERHADTLGIVFLIVDARRPGGGNAGGVESHIVEDLNGTRNISGNGFSIGFTDKDIFALMGVAAVLQIPGEIVGHDLRSDGKVGADVLLDDIRKSLDVVGIDAVDPVGLIEPSQTSGAGDH